MYNGIVNVYKEKGFTSFDVVAKLRGIMGQKKIGHTGTLDPDATGVLPVCLGSGTKLVDMLTDKVKVYEAEMLLGTTTDTEDISGTVIEKKSFSFVTDTMIYTAVKDFIGDIMQIPPMYSAIKVDGRRLYELARQGVTIERKPRNVTIHDIEILEISIPIVRLRVTCGKGTYIRSLCRDIGEKLGCGACMQSLVRTRVDSFNLDNAYTLSELQKLKSEGKLATSIIGIDEVFSALPRIDVPQIYAKLLMNGNKLPAALCASSDKDAEYRVYYDNVFYGIYRLSDDGKELTIVKMFYNG